MGFQPAVKLRPSQRRQAGRLLGVAAVGGGIDGPGQGDDRVAADRGPAVHGIVPALPGLASRRVLPDHRHCGLIAPLLGRFGLFGLGAVEN